MSRRKLTVVEQGFILHNYGRMNAKEMAKELSGIGPQTVQNFIEENGGRESNNDNMEAKDNREINPQIVQVELVQKETEERKPNPVDMPKRTSQAGRDEHGRSVVMTEAESQQGDEFYKDLPKNAIDRSKVFIPNPDKKSF